LIVLPTATHRLAHSSSEDASRHWHWHVLVQAPLSSSGRGIMSRPLRLHWLVHSPTETAVFGHVQPQSPLHPPSDAFQKAKFFSSDAHFVLHDVSLATLLAQSHEQGFLQPPDVRPYCASEER
jgi:hypothetical protein